MRKMYKYIILFCSSIVLLLVLGGCGGDEGEKQYYYHECPKCEYELTFIPVMINNIIHQHPIPKWKSCINWPYESNVFEIKNVKGKEK